MFTWGWAITSNATDCIFLDSNRTTLSLHSYYNLFYSSPVRGCDIINTTVDQTTEISSSDDLTPTIKLQLFALSSLCVIFWAFCSSQLDVKVADLLLFSQNYNTPCCWLYCCELITHSSFKNERIFRTASTFRIQRQIKSVYRLPLPSNIVLEGEKGSWVFWEGTVWIGSILKVCLGAASQFNSLQSTFLSGLQ